MNLLNIIHHSINTSVCFRDACELTLYVHILYRKLICYEKRAFEIKKNSKKKRELDILGQHKKFI